MGNQCTCRITEVEGLTAIRLENEWLEVTVLPDKGADIYSLVSKPHGLDVLWKSPWGLRAAVPVEMAAAGQAAWLDQYEGGWQLIFPNGGDACHYRGAPLSFHGEASASRWKYSIVEAGPEKASLELSLALRRSPFSVTRRLSIERDRAVLHIDESILNHGDVKLRYMWGHHPAFGRPFLDGCVLEVPAGRFVAHEQEISRFSRIAPSESAEWPMIEGRDGQMIDLRVVPPPEVRATELGYITGLKQGWYAMVNPRRKLGFGLVWPLDVFPYLWFWQELGGSPDYPWYGRCSVMAVEPFTSIPGSGLERAIAGGTAPELAPGGQVSARLTAVLFEAGRVESISADGEVRYAAQS